MKNKVAPLVLVGAGKMGGALLDAWLDYGLSGNHITVIDPEVTPDRREALWERGVTLTVHESYEPEMAPRILVFAVKPQLMEVVLPALAAHVARDTIIVSIAAGTTLENLAHAFPVGQSIIRVMPNTPAQIGAGMTVICGNRYADDTHISEVEFLFSAVGEVSRLVDESMMDAVTALSGSGPAYVFLLAECMARAGEAAGLPAELAARLARQTVIGGGGLLAQSDLDLATLRQHVTSPGGTTEAALEILTHEKALETLIERAVLAAKARSIIL